MHWPHAWRHVWTPSAATTLGVAVALGCGSPEQVVLGTGPSTPGVDGAATSPVNAGSVTGFVLVDVTTGLEIRPLADGDTIDTHTSPVTIQALTNPYTVGSVIFAVDGSTVRVEEHPLYSIAGDDLQAGKPFAWIIAAGVHRVTATPYSAPRGGGVAGVALEQTFQIQ